MPLTLDEKQIVWLMAAARFQNWRESDATLAMAFADSVVLYHLARERLKSSAATSRFVTVADEQGRGSNVRYLVSIDANGNVHIVPATEGPEV